MGENEIHYTGECVLIIKNGKAYIKATKYLKKSSKVSEEDIQYIIDHGTEISLKTANAIMDKNEV